MSTGDKKQSLPEALAERDLECVKALILEGGDVNGSDSDGYTALHLAARKDDEAFAKLLLERGAVVNAATKDGAVPLHSAVAGSSDGKIVKLLLESGAAVDAKLRNGSTALHYAAHEKLVAAAQALLEGGALVDAKNQENKTPLHFAVREGATQVAALLLKAGAALNARDKEHWTPLLLGARAGSTEAVALLLKAGAEVDEECASGNTPLDYAAINGATEVVALLLEAGADFRKNHPLGHAANEAILKLLIDRGAVLDRWISEQGWTPLHRMADMNAAGLAAQLLDEGAVIDAKTDKGQSPLHVAVASGNQAVTKVLLDRGAPVDSRDNRGFTPLHVAATAVYENPTTIVTMLLDAGAAIDAKTEDSKMRTPLQMALAHICFPVFKLLLSRGASLKNESGETLLHYAATLRNGQEAIQLLLDHGAVVEAMGSHFDETPLHSAVRHRNHGSIALLLDRGADVTAKDSMGHTALHKAAYSGDLEAVKLLLARGADIDAKDKFWTSPLAMALDNKKNDVAQLLRERGAHEFSLSDVVELCFAETLAEKKAKELQEWKQRPSDDDIRRKNAMFRDLFRQVDSDKSSSLDAKEMAKLTLSALDMSRDLAKKTKQSAVEEQKLALDAEPDQEKAAAAKQELDADLQSQLEAIDKIFASELENVEALAEKIFKEVDHDKNGSVSAIEFSFFKSKLKEIIERFMFQSTSK